MYTYSQKNKKVKVHLTLDTFLSIRQYSKLIRTDADLNVVWYEKIGGKRRADRDFFKLDAYDVSKGYDKNLQCIWKMGTVGDNTLEYLGKYSEYIPLSSNIHLQEKFSRDDEREYDSCCLQSVYVRYLKEKAC